jgi:DNA segregation ATPase FtsK/SpoIIIE-like protein
MNEPLLIGRQRAVVRDLAALAAEKARVEPALAAARRDEIDRAEQAFRDGRDRLRQRCDADRSALETQLRQKREDAEAAWAAEQDAAKTEYKKARKELLRTTDAEREATEAAVQEARWSADAVLEGTKSDAANRLREETRRLAARREELQALDKASRSLLARWNLPAEEPGGGGAPDGPRKINECLEEARGRLAELEKLVLPRLLRGRRLTGLAVLFFLLLVFPCGWLTLWLLGREFDPAWLAGCGVVVGGLLALLVGWLARLVVYSLARKQTAAQYAPLCQALQAGEAALQQVQKRSQAEHDRTLRDAETRHADETARAAALEKKLEEIAHRRTSGQTILEDRFRTRYAAGEQRRTATLLAAERHFKQESAHLVLMFENDGRQFEADHRARLAEVEGRFQQQWKEQAEQWRQALTAAARHAQAVNAESEALFPGWDAPAWQAWRPPAALPPAMRFGAYRVKTESVVAAEPWQKGRPAPRPIDVALPACCTFPEARSLLLHAQDDGREAAAAALRTMMFRLLTSLPPGRVRFLIIDPVGLGQNFAAFMNLTDYDEALVGSRIWTESAQVEQRLADLTAHMENVIQKYLRNRYATISEYNEQAGEVAEPFRVLVAANFPVNFSTEAARRLVSIAQSGPRCGVSTLVSIDRRQPLPKDFDLADLERCGDNLVWEASISPVQHTGPASISPVQHTGPASISPVQHTGSGRFRWRDEDFGPYPLTLDQLPGDDFANRILQQVGEGAKNAKRVEVPFEFIAPAEGQFWTGSARQGVSIALGRAGATRRQMLELGKGTSQHALVVGKTGSGKSTLLHALVTNLALLYSPDEVELYLVDFKKGVEFKTYAVHDLPHARVIAVESEREFGLSVLQRLDAELHSRGERFRAAGAQDLNAYRTLAPEARSPRVLLVVDEFQEFFIEDDRIAHEASRLLDRLVRQGRAFGMHVLLGSQTIGGAYSLARSTIDQMAVRIALQCSEADAHLVLSADNSAARLLSRPGEAIYNNANGLVEGNDPFQVVWLGDAQREQYLKTVAQMAASRPLKPRAPAVVFEGNATADVAGNPHLARLLADGAPAQDPGARAESAWLGEAMAIDELTAAVFRRQNGSNLLVVGQQAESAPAMLALAVLGLAAQAAPPSESGPATRFYVVDGQQADAPRSGVLARLAEVLPGVVKLTGTRELPGVLAELTAELDRRQKGGSAEGPNVYLVLCGLQRMRDLRKSEDDFGYMRAAADAPPSPDKLLSALLREGSALGLHTLVWCDTLNNLQRAFDRAAMREFALRVVFQLSVADSSNLIDNPAASKLGMNRALFASEEEGRLEKFRPYGAPSDGWLDGVREQFRRRAAAAEVVSGAAPPGLEG